MSTKPVGTYFPHIDHWYSHLCRAYCCGSRCLCYSHRSKISSSRRSEISEERGERRRQRSERGGNGADCLRDRDDAILLSCLSILIPRNQKEGQPPFYKLYSGESCESHPFTLLICTQYRGSIPVYWAQELNSMTAKPPIESEYEVYDYRALPYNYSQSA